MGFLEAIAAFFRSFSGRKKKTGPGSEAVLVAVFPEWIEKKTAARLKAVEKNALNRFVEIRQSLKMIRSHLDKLEKTVVPEEKGNARFRKVASASQQAVVPRLRVLVEKLEPPKSPSLEQTVLFSRTAFPLLQKEMQTVGKNIVYTSVVLKEDMKLLGQEFESLEKQLQELQQTVEEDALLEKKTLCISRFSAFSDAQSAVLESEQALYRAEKEVRFAQQKTGEQKAFLLSLEKSPEFGALEKVASELQSVEAEAKKADETVSLLVAEIEKPLHRFVQLVNGNQWRLEKQDASFLQALSRSPVSALEADPKGQLFSRLVSEMESAVKEGILSFKDEKETEKQLAAMEKAKSFDFFSDFFWKKNELAKKKIALEKNREQHPLRSALEKTRRELSSLAVEMVSLEKERQGVLSTLEKNRSVLEERKKEVEELASVLSGKNITLVLGEE